MTATGEPTVSQAASPAEPSVNGRGRLLPEPSRSRRRAYVLVVVYVALVTALMALHALVDDFAFLGMGWILVLAALPLLPWLMPMVAPLIERIAPRVQSVKLPGGFEVSLLAAARPVAGLGSVEAVLTADHLARPLASASNPFSTTDAKAVIAGVQSVRAAGAPAVVLDLGNGMKWRLPNLYFTAWLLQNDPAARWFVFTHSGDRRAGTFVGVAAASAVVSGIDAAFPAYAGVGPILEFRDPSLASNETHLAEQFNAIVHAVAPPIETEDPATTWVAVVTLHGLLGPHLSPTAVDWAGALDREEMLKLVDADAPLVGATTADREFRGVIDQRAVAVEFAKRVLGAD